MHIFCTQQEEIDYIETSTLVARLEVVHISLPFAKYTNIKLYQMDVNNVFLNGFIKEEVYVEQTPGFENSTHPNHVINLLWLYMV